MKPHRILLRILLLIILLSACRKIDPTSEPQLEGTTWVLTTYNDQQPIANRQPTLQFEADQVSGTTGCNHYNGTYQIEGDSIRFEGIFNTEMACLEPEGLMDQERIYLELLRVVNRFEINANVLIFYAASNHVLIFEIQSDEPILIEPASGLGEPVSIDKAPTPTSVSAFESPDGFTLYQDSIAGISVYIPEDWIATGIIEGQYALFLSYPEDKYVGGEALDPGDTKCDFNIQLPGTQVDDLVSQWQSDSFITILSETDYEFSNGITGKRFEIDSMGRTITFVAEVNSRVILLTCFGNTSRVDEVAATLGGME